MVLYPNKLPESERVCSGICNPVNLVIIRSLGVDVKINYLSMMKIVL